MSPRRHVDDLFTGALDDDLSPIDEARFQNHMRSCTDCAAAYAEYTATVEALHGLPKAHMARVIHLPSTPPAAERSPRRRISLGWLNAGLLRRFPATAIAGVAAIVIVIVALAHGNSQTASNGIDNTAGGSGNAAAAPGVATSPGALQAACISQIATVATASPPVDFAMPPVRTTSGAAGAHFVLAASSLKVTSGQKVTLFAQLSLPVSSIGGPGSTSVVPATRSLRPCVSVTVGGTGEELGSAGVPAAPPIYGSSVPAPAQAVSVSPADQSLLIFAIPSGLPSGTDLLVTATIPAGFEGVGSPALTANLTLTTR